jgi:uncharacterized protein Yka (UPF0111/DUF47 family)
MEDLHSCLKSLQSIKSASQKIFESNQKVFEQVHSSVTLFKKLKEDYDIQIDQISQENPIIEKIENVYK